jgi:hypothetical protein
MFAIFGMSKKLAERELDKKLRNVNSSFTRKFNELSQDEQVLAYDKEVNRLFKSMKAKQVSGDLSTPDTAKDMLRIMKQAGGFKDLEIKVRVPSRDKAGQVKRSKTSNKILLTWVVIAEYERHLELFKTAA